MIIKRKSLTITGIIGMFSQPHNVNEIRVIVTHDVMSFTEMFCRNVSGNDAVVVHVT